MIKKINFNISNICEFLIISLPVCLLFSNIISEIIVFVLILICFKNLDKNILKKKFHDLIFFLFLIISIYLIINYFVNFLKNPDFLRSFFFIRFPLYAFSLYLILDVLDLNLNRIIKSWTVIIIIIILDLFFQFNFGKNFLGYPSIPQDYIYRLGGFLNDELKIANLIIYFFVPIFTYFHQNFFDSSKKKILIFTLITVVYIAIFLTGERSNFLTFNIFIFLYFLLTNLRKYFITYLIISLSLLLIFTKSFENHLTKRMVTDIYKIYKEQILNNNENGFLYKNNHYFSHYSIALQINKNHRLFGVGMKNFRNFCDNNEFNDKVHPDFINLKCSTHPHNFYFEIISELGLIGFFVILISLFLIFYNFLRVSLKKENYFLLGNSLILILFFTPMLPKGSFFTNWNAMIFWTILGLCLYSYNRSKSPAEK
jgi:O-antigen ligase